MEERQITNLALNKKEKVSQREIYEIAKEQSYLTIAKGSGAKLKKDFFAWCEKSHHPYIVIEKGTLTSAIHMDFWPMATSGKNLSYRKIEQLWQILFRYANPREDNALDAIKYIPNDEVFKVAQEILEIINKPESANTEDVFDEKALVAAIERMANEKIKKPRRTGNALTAIRGKDVSIAVKERANGICELCKHSAPFKDYQGKPYLEVHHIIWISRGGEDCVENAAALCPNCHRKMHILDLPEDRIYLKKKASALHLKN